MCSQPVQEAVGIFGYAPHGPESVCVADSVVFDFLTDGLLDALADAEAPALGLPLAEALGLALGLTDADADPALGAGVARPDVAASSGTSAAVWRDVSGPTNRSKPITTATATSVPRMAKVIRPFDFGAR
ncbi:hypothetical protein AB0F72_35940 [Actinoplanes sp. NPDC023936]|uniref:hypothetical protein n=1 Tax=Actinoplanes sp. NPDC023936 TaxID=3154910 RepID=UPI00340FE4B6